MLFLNSIILSRRISLFTIYYGSGNHEQRLFIYPEKYGDASERYEAALLDGAGFVKASIHITLPLLQDVFKYVLTVAFVISFFSAAKAINSFFF